MLRWGGAPRSFVHPWTVTRRRRSSVSVSADTKTTHLKFRRIKTSKLLSTFDCIGPYNSQIALFSRDCAQRRTVWTSPTNWFHAQFGRAWNQLVGSGLVGRAPSAIASQSGSGKNRLNFPDPSHLRVDPVFFVSVELYLYQLP